MLSHPFFTSLSELLAMKSKQIKRTIRIADLPLIQSVYMKHVFRFLHTSTCIVYHELGRRETLEHMLPIPL